MQKKTRQDFDASSSPSIHQAETFANLLGSRGLPAVGPRPRDQVFDHLRVAGLSQLEIGVVAQAQGEVPATLEHDVRKLEQVGPVGEHVPLQVHSRREEIQQRIETQARAEVERTAQVMLMAVREKRRMLPPQSGHAAVLTS